MIFRAIHADATEMMFFSQTVLITELVDWLEKSDPKFQYVGADYVEPPELKTVTAEAPRVDGDTIQPPRDEDSLGEGQFGTVVSKTMWEQTWCKKMKVALKRAATWAAGQAEERPVANAEPERGRGRRRTRDRRGDARAPRTQSRLRRGIRSRRECGRGHHPNRRSSPRVIARTAPRADAPERRRDA